MSQVQVAWETLAGAQYVESEDESWLNHSGFHLSGDSEDDDVHSLTAEAYVHAVNALKGASIHRQRLHQPTQQPLMLLELPVSSGAGAAESHLHPATLEPKSDSLAEAAVHSKGHPPASDAPLVYNPGNGQPQSTAEGSAPSTVDAQQHTMHALEMLFPSERLTAQPALRTQRIAALKATVESKRSASQPVTTAKQSALLGADADASIPQSAQLPTQSHAAPATSDCGLPRMLAQLQQQQKLTSPASRVASAPFTGPVPHAVAQQQAGKQEQSGSQQHPSKAGTPLAGGPLQLSLSVEQIVLLQAAADNAQRYLDSDSPPDKADADPEQNTQGTDRSAKVQQTARWDMQTAIVDAFKTILPSEAQPEAATPVGKSPTASGAASASAPHAPQSSRPTQTAAPDSTQRSQGNPGAQPPQSASVPLPEQLPVTSTTADADAEQQAHASAPLTAQAKSASAAASFLPATAVVPQPVSHPPAAGTAEAAGLKSAAVQAAKARAAAGIVAAVKAASAADAAAARAPAANTAPAAVEHVSTPVVPAANVATPVTQGPAAASRAASLASSGRRPPVPAALASSAPTAATATSTAGTGTAATAAPTAGTSPSAAAAAPFATAIPVSATSPDTAAGAALSKLSALPSVSPHTTSSQRATAAVSTPALTATAATQAAALTSNSTDTTSAPAAAVSVVMDPFTNTQRHLLSSVSRASPPTAAAAAAAAAAAGAGSQTLHHVAPAASPAAAVQPVPSTPVSASASPGTGFVPMSLSAVSAPESASPGKLFVPMSLSAVSAPETASNSSGWARFLNAHAPLALLQGSSSGGTTPVTSLPMTKGMLNQASTARAPTSLVSPVSRAPGAVSQSPASLASAPLLPLAPLPTSWSSPGVPLSQTPSNLTSRPNSTQGFSNIPTSPSLFSPAPPVAPDAAQSKRQKKRNREQAQLTQSEHSHAPSGAQASIFLPSSSKPATGSDLSPPSLTPPSKPQGTPDSEPHTKRLHQDDARPVSKELAAMRKAHGNSSIPRVGADAVSPQLMGQHVKSLVLYKHYEYNLQDICNAIGWFAIGQESEVDIFLGDLHNSHYLQQQIYSIAALFGVRIFQSQHPSRFHEKYHLTRLVQTPEAGILTVHGDILVYFILELAELSKLNNKQGGDKYRRELKAALELANAVGRKGLGTGPNTLTRGSVLRLQQLLEKGYLAVKRPKGNKQQYKPAPYPGWRGRPRYGPPTSTSLPPSPPLQLPLPPSPQPATAAKSPPKQTSPLGATAVAVLGQQVTAAAPHGDVPSQRPPSSPRNSLFPIPAPLPSATAANLSPPASKLHTASPASPMPPSQHPSAQGTMTPQAVGAAPPAVPSSLGHSEQQLSDASAALVSAVGPLFEDFVAQTEAVMSDPSTSLQGLTGSITQQLAAAIATAAVQLVETRRHRSTACLPGPPSQLSLPVAAPASVLASLPASASAPLPSTAAATTSAAGSMSALTLPPMTASLAPTAPMTVAQQLPTAASVLSGTPILALPPIPSANSPGPVGSSASAAGAKAASASAPAVAPVTTAASPVATAASLARSAASPVATAAALAGSAAPPVATAAPPAPAAVTAAEQPALGSGNQLAAVSPHADAPATGAAEPAASATAARTASQAAALQAGDKGVSSGTAKASVVTKFVQEQERAKGRHEVIAWRGPDTSCDQVKDKVKAKAGTVVSKGQLKHDSSAALASDNAKQPKTAVTAARGAVKSDRYVMPRLDVKKSEPTKAQGTDVSSQAAGKQSQTRVLEVPRASAGKLSETKVLEVPRAAAGKQGEKRVVSVSKPMAWKQVKAQKVSKTTAASSTSSRGSDKSSPASSGPLHASSRRQGNSNGPSQRSGSSRGVSRRSSEPSSQSGDGRFGLHSVPSRLGGAFAHSLPMMNAPLPFNPHVPMSDAQLSQSVGSLGFRPHGMMGPYSGMMPGPQAGMGHGFPSHMMPPGPSDWQGQPSGMNPFPVAGHMLPGFDNAPDFSFAN